MRFERLALDTNAAVDFLRVPRPVPPPLAEAGTLIMPLFVLAELKYGAIRSRMPNANLGEVEGFLEICEILVPDTGTSDFYARVRNQFETGRSIPAGFGRLEGLHNDLWIAALCVQHKLPLLSNDRDFDGIERLEVIHW